MLGITGGAATSLFLLFKTAKRTGRNTEVCPLNRCRSIPIVSSAHTAWDDGTQRCCVWTLLPSERLDWTDYLSGRALKSWCLLKTCLKFLCLPKFFLILLIGCWNDFYYYYYFLFFYKITGLFNILPLDVALL